MSGSVTVYDAVDCETSLSVWDNSSRSRGPRLNVRAEETVHGVDVFVRLSLEDVARLHKRLGRFIEKHQAAK